MKTLLEIAEVMQTLFPWAADYLAVYERFGLAAARPVMAHNVHTTDSELERLAGARHGHRALSRRATRRSAAGFPVAAAHRGGRSTAALGTDVGAGTGFGILKEGLHAYLTQRIAPDGLPLDPDTYVVSGDARRGRGTRPRGCNRRFHCPGKSADFVYLRPPEGSPLAGRCGTRREPGDAVLAALFTLAGPESVREVRVEGADGLPAHMNIAAMSIDEINPCTASASWRPRLGLRAFALGRGARLGTAAVLATRRLASAHGRASRRGAPEEQLALLRAHPGPGNPRPHQRRFAQASKPERGLDQLTPEEFDRLTRLNCGVS